MHRSLLLATSTAALLGAVALRAPAADRSYAHYSTAPFADASFLVRHAGALRVLTWNIGANSVVPSGRDDEHSRPASFARVVAALDPDIACLQELTIGPERAAALFDRIRPLGNGERWHAVSVLGNVLVSRYPLSDRRASVFRERFSQRGHVIARVALPGGAVAPTVACMHLQAKGGEANLAFRNRHARAVATDLAAAPGPVIALGDLNAVDADKPYLRTLMDGDVANTNAFPLVAAEASHNGASDDRYTWRNDRSGFAPGTLDYILFTGAQYPTRTAFVLNTRALSDDALASSGLRRDDSLRDGGRDEWDHLPVVVDLAR